jgi:hypothetical protein
VTAHRQLAAEAGVTRNHNGRATVLESAATRG